MNLILSDLVSKRRDWNTVPVTGLAFVAIAKPEDEHGPTVHQVRLVEAQLTSLVNLKIDGAAVNDAEVWFEDARERSH